MKKPNLFIVGHPRSGTSSLHHYLKQHPDIFLTAIKEPNYFDWDFREQSDNFHKKKLYFPFRSESQYLRLYKKWGNEKIAGEASAMNLCSKVSAQEIHLFNPKSKIIMMLREPVDFLHSYHSAARFALGEHHEDFRTALSAEKERKEGRDLSKRVITPAWLFYSEFIKYAEQISRYFAYFGCDQIKIIIFDDFKENTRDIYREVLEFLSVDPNFYPEFEIINPNKELKWPLLKKHTLDSPYFRKTLRLLVSDDLYAAMKNFYKNKIVKYKVRQAIDEKFKKVLMAKFKSEVEALSDLLKRDLIARWGYGKVRILDNQIR
jgi:hypothetical protein